MHLINGWLGKRALPAGVDALDQTMRGVGCNRVVGGLAQRQPAGNLRQRGEVEPVGPQRSALGGTAGWRGVLEPQVTARPVAAIDLVELQLGGGKFQRSASLLARDPTLHVAQCQRFQFVSQQHVDLGERHIGSATDRFSCNDVGPDPQGAIALAYFAVFECHVAPQAGNVDLRQIGIQRAVPRLPVATTHREQRLAKLPAQGESFAPTGRRRGVQAQRMLAAAVARDEPHAGQQQGLGVSQFVGPAHRTAFDDELALRKEPVDGGLAGRVGRQVLRDVETGDMQLAGSVAPHVECRAVEVELLEAEAPERSGRHARHDPFQSQGFTLSGVVQDHVMQFQRGEQTG